MEGNMRTTYEQGLQNPRVPSAQIGARAACPVEGLQTTALQVHEEHLKDLLVDLIQTNARLDRLHTRLFGDDSPEVKQPQSEDPPAASVLHAFEQKVRRLHDIAASISVLTDKLERLA
jgi:hypothetical protein